MPRRSWRRQEAPSRWALGRVTRSTSQCWQACRSGLMPRSSTTRWSTATLSGRNTRRVWRILPLKSGSAGPTFRPGWLRNTKALAKLLVMEDPEAWLRGMTAPLARAREGSPFPVARLSVEAVANAFVVLGLLPAARAEEILAAQRPVLEAAGFRVGREIGELSVNPGARIFQAARAASLDNPRQIPLAVAAGPARLPLRRHDLAITWATLTPEGIRLSYRGGARSGDRDVAGALVREITEDIAELSIADDTGRTYRVPAANVPSGISGRCLASGETRWIPEGEFLATPVRGEAMLGGAGSRGGGPAIR